MSRLPTLERYLAREIFGAVAFVLVILGASMMSVVADFTQDIFTEIARIGD